METLTDIFATLSNHEELLLIDDQGSVYTDDGDYQQFFRDLINQLRGSPRPLLAFAQTRMMPARFALENKLLFSCFNSSF